MKSDSTSALVRSYLCEQKFSFAAALLWRGLYVIVPMQVPVITGAIVDGLTRHDVSFYGFHWRGAQPGDVLAVSVAGLIAVAIAYGVSSYGRMMSTAQLARGFVTSLRQKIVDHLGRLSVEQHRQFGAAELLDRTLADTREMRQFVDRVFIQSVANALRLGYPVVMMLALDWALALMALAILIPQWLISRWLQSRLHNASRLRRSSQSELTRAVKEMLDGIATIKSVNATAAIDAVHPRTKDVEQDELRANRFTALVQSNVWMLTSVGLAIVWWRGGVRVLDGSMTLGTLVVFTGFITFAYQPFRQFSTIVNTYRQGLVSLERIAELLAVQPDIASVAGAGPLSVREGRIRFAGVHFSRGGRKILDGVDLEIKPRQITAIAGASGSGKSSLVRLVPRLQDPDAGEVLIDDQPICGATLESLRSQVALVNQQPMLFSGTVMDNICIGRPDATTAEVERACRDAGAWGFVRKLAGGLQSRVGHGGANLSGGQIQRLSIARALLNEPRILLLDEPTSALDQKRELSLMETLRKLRDRMTIVVVAHRPVTLEKADEVIVIRAGRVVAGKDSASKKIPFTPAQLEFPTLARAA